MAIFVATCSAGACMLMSGAGSNKTKRKYEFLRGKVFECKATDNENAEKIKQENVYQVQKEKDEAAQAQRDKDRVAVHKNARLL